MVPVSIGASNTEFVMARVRSRRAALYDEEDYRKLIRMGPGGIARFMEESGYEREINELGTRFSGVNLIEYALNQNMARHFGHLLDWAEGPLYDQIARYLRKFDVWNIKTAIRGAYTDATSEEITTDYIHAGELDEATLERMAEAEDIESVVDHLAGTIYQDPLEEALADYDRTELLVPLENALDRAFYQRLLGDLGKPREGPAAKYVEFLEAEIDFRNVRNALRLAGSEADVDPTEYFIEGGVLFTEDDLRRLVTDRDELVDFVADHGRYGDKLDRALADLRDAESLIAFEHALDGALLEYADTLATTYPVSVGAVLSYILAKEREVENIRAIARGREVGLEQSEIEQELVIQ